MENTNCLPKSPQKFVAENIAFLSKIRPEDIEYSDELMKIMSTCSIDSSNGVVEQIQTIDENDVYFDSFPNDRFTVLIGNDYHQCQIHYYKKNGMQFDTVAELLGNKIIDRVVKIGDIVA